MRAFLRDLAKRIKKDEPLRKRFVSFIHRMVTRSKELFVDFRELWIALLILIVVGGTSLGMLFLLASPNEDETTDDVTITTEVYRHPLTGLRLLEPLAELPQVFSVMVENSADAWPLVGLDKAFLVIEAPVEGTIPRFIAFFSEESDAEKIGPVRSARPYYLDWALELDALYGHSGGSPEALLAIDSMGILDLNEFSQGEYYYRENGSRYAPHNLYTSIDRLVLALEELAPEVPSYESWTFKDDEPVQGDGASLSVDFAEGTIYDVIWKYLPETNIYERYQSGFVMEMEDGATIEANNVVVMATGIRTIDSIGRKSIITVGSGDAFLIQDGVFSLIQWEKESASDRLKFTYYGGTDVEFNAGVTWIEVVSGIEQVEIE
ncbi:MAG: DUF3048 domain-containing protein [Patescibacteria group bacterium]|jgi:hypothetical protein